MVKNNAYDLRLAKTLFENTYAAHVLNDNKDVIGKLRIVPSIPLDRSVLPENAPVVSPFLLVIVDDADINKDNLIDFEERVSYALLKRFSTETVHRNRCFPALPVLLSFPGVHF